MNTTIRETIISDEFKDTLADLLRNDAIDNLIHDITTLERKSIDIEEFKRRNLGILDDIVDYRDEGDFICNMVNNLSIRNRERKN